MYRPGIHLVPSGRRNLPLPWLKNRKYVPLAERDIDKTLIMRPENVLSGQAITLFLPAEGTYKIDEYLIFSFQLD
ncbi:MAG: hypothetical protein AAF939_20345 [Planctomycetota bacterium]